MPLVKMPSAKTPVSSAKKQNSRREKKMFRLWTSVGGLDLVVLDDLVVEPGHLLGGFDVGVVDALELRLLDARPGQEERGVAGQVGESCVERVACAGVDCDDLLAVADDQEPRAQLR